MFKIMKKKELVSPAKGRIIPMEAVEDEVFAAKMMGDGFAVIPESGSLVSPCNGVVIDVFKTKHAIIIKDEYDLELIIHVGIDTVKLNGEGFDVKVVPGQKVKKGDPLMEVDLELLKKHNKPLVTPVVITNMDIIKSFHINEGHIESSQVALIFK